MNMMFVFVPLFTSLTALAEIHPATPSLTNILNNDSDILDCYLDSKAADRKMPDTLTVQFALSDDGKPSNISAVQQASQLEDPKFQACVVQVVSKMSYPEHAKNRGDVQAKLSFP